MEAANPSVFPIRIEEPSACNFGSVYVSDLALDGLDIGPNAFERAICTLARECTSGSLRSVVVPDARTALVTTVDGTRTQLELFYADEPLDEATLETVFGCLRDDSDRMAVATVADVTVNARAFCKTRAIEVLKMTEFEPESGPWTPSG